MRVRGAGWKTLAAMVSVVVGSAGLAAAGAGPAAADPIFGYVAVGSETTQGVMDQFAVDLAGYKLASYDALNPINGRL
jgi:hypothetical protein